MMLEGHADQLIDDLVSMCQLTPAQLELFNRQPIAYLRQEYGTAHARDRTRPHSRIEERFRAC
jgi:hypothetical protein